MSFEMESEKHAINMTYDPVHGLTIIGLKCPHEKKIEALRKYFKFEIEQARRQQPSLRSLLQEGLKILESSEFKEKEDNENQVHANI